MSNESLLTDFLEMTVPFMIADISRQGGIQDWQLERVKDHADAIGGQGDAILYYEKGKSSKMVSLLAECLAVLAFAPGGVKFAGLHFEGHPSYEVEPTDTSWLDALMTESEPTPEPVVKSAGIPASPIQSKMWM